MVPNTAVPNELPSVRKNVTPEVAVPNSAYSTVFWTAMVNTCMHRPIPSPSTNMYTDSSHALVELSIRESKYSPSAITRAPTIGKIRYFPVLLTTLPEKIDAINRPITMGKVRTPEMVAESPSTYCRYVGRNVIAPSIAKPTMKLRIEQTVNTGLRNRCIGSIGCLARVSTQQNSPSATMPPTKSPMMTPEPHAYSLPPQLVARIRALAPTATSAMPR